MNFFPAVLSPLLFLFVSAGRSVDVPETDITNEKEVAGADGSARGSGAADWTVADFQAPGLATSPLLTDFDMQPAVAWQMRIEKRVIIRITPHARMPVQPQMLAEMPSGGFGPRLVERRMGDCVSASLIAGVQPSGSQGLVFYLRDRRVVSAELERGCRSRDFYSGLSLQRPDDGKRCIDRDRLQARNGAACRLTRIRQLVEVVD